MAQGISPSLSRAPELKYVPEDEGTFNIRTLLADDLNSNSLQIETTGTLKDLQTQPNYANAKTRIEQDSAILERLNESTFDEALSPNYVNTQLLKFKNYLFEKPDQAGIPGGSAKEYRKTFYKEVIANFHTLVQLIAQMQSPTAEARQAYIDLMKQLSKCIGGLQYVVNDSLSILAPITGRQKEALAELRTQVSGAVIAEHVEDLVKNRHVEAGNSIHVANRLKMWFANEFNFTPPKDVNSWIGYKDDFRLGMRDELTSALATPNLVNIIFEQTYSMFLTVLTTTNEVDVVYLTEPVLSFIETQLKSLDVNEPESVITKTEVTCPSLCILSELLDVIEYGLRVHVSESNGVNLDSKKIVETLRVSIVNHHSVKKVTAFRVETITDTNTSKLETAFRDTAGKYIKRQSREAVAKCVTGSSINYLLKSELFHNMNIVIAQGLHDTFIKTDLNRIPLRSVQPTHPPTQHFTYTHEQGYFWVEEYLTQHNKPIKLSDKPTLLAVTPVTLAVISTIDLSDWKDEDLLRCFALALASPFTLDDLSKFIGTNLLKKKTKEAQSPFKNEITKLIDSDPQMYVPLFANIKGSDNIYDWLRRAIINLSKSTKIKLARNLIKLDNTAFCYFLINICDDDKIPNTDLNGEPLSLFHLAVIEQKNTIVKFLLKCADEGSKSCKDGINWQSPKEKLSALHCAVYARNFDAIELLLAAKTFNYNSVTKNDYSALDLAISLFSKGDSFCLALELLTAKSGIGYHRGPIIELITADNVEIYNAFKSHFKPNFLIRLSIPYSRPENSSLCNLEDRFSLLHIAIIQGAIEIVKDILAKGASESSYISLKSKHYGFTALHCAICCGNDQVVSTLLDSELFDVNELTSNREHPLTMAIKMHQMDKTDKRKKCVVRMLENNKIDYNVVVGQKRKRFWNQYQDVTLLEQVKAKGWYLIHEVTISENGDYLLIEKNTDDSPIAAKVEDN